MVNQHKLGLTLGVFMGVMHLVWSLLVLTGLAQPLVNLFLRLHFVSSVHAITAFSWGSALGLIALASTIGYILGNVLGMIWNKIK